MGHRRIILQKSTYEKIRPFVKGRKLLKRYPIFPSEYTRQELSNGKSILLAGRLGLI